MQATAVAGGATAADGASTSTQSALLRILY
jgi:hypothetical protein